MATKEQKANRRRVEQSYYRTCSGVQIDIMDIPKVFAVGEKAIADGATEDVTLDAAIIAFVGSIRKN